MPEGAGPSAHAEVSAQSKNPAHAALKYLLPRVISLKLMTIAPIGETAFGPPTNNLTLPYSEIRTKFVHPISLAG